MAEVAQVSDERAAELALCRAAADGDERAIGTLDRRYLAEIDRVLRSYEPDLVDEIKQRLRHKLFVAEPGEVPGIARFDGRGPLGRYLQVIATREALMHARTTRRAVARERDFVVHDHELQSMRREYRAEFERAFADALAGLASKERNLLYYHLVGGLSIDRIGALYNVHRVTAFRWLRDARSALIAQTRALLGARMQLATEELDSLLRLVQSRASVSVERLLREARG
jgi:RNA polymerase sigma-70 factor (ECF subfamily)